MTQHTPGPWRPAQHESDANALLMAAAPDLLTALVELHRICLNCDMKKPAGTVQPPTKAEYESAMDAAEAAIDAATGAAS